MLRKNAKPVLTRAGRNSQGRARIHSLRQKSAFPFPSRLPQLSRKGTASAVPPEESKCVGFSRWGTLVRWELTWAIQVRSISQRPKPTFSNCLFDPAVILALS
jgi:hypothetical protein